MNRFSNISVISARMLSLLIALALVVTTVFILPVTDVDAAAKKSKTRSASMAPVMKNGAVFDHRVAAGESLYGYDTLQGACANGGYAYMTLYNRNVESCKIVKVSLSSMDVVKVSEPLPVYHANCLTYNTRRNLLLATCCQIQGKRAVFIDPVSLTAVGYKDIRLTKRVKKLPKSVRRKYKGFTAIAYNEQRDCYVGRLRGNNNVIIFDGDLNPVKYVKLKGKKTSLLNQGMDSYGGYIYDVRSFKGKKKYSLVTVHTMSGKYVGQVKFPYGQAPGLELQCIFHNGSQFYAGFYYTTSQQHDTQGYGVNRVNSLYCLYNMY